MTAAESTPDRPPDDLAARALDAALGELSADERAQVEAELASHPDAAAIRERQRRLAAALAAAETHPALAAQQPRVAWREQTLHKAKVAAAKRRQIRQQQQLPVARPPLTHRQLAGKTAQAFSADDIDPFGTGAATGLPGWPGPLPPGLGGRPIPPPPPPVRRLFLTVAIAGMLGVLALALLAARLLHQWQVEPGARTNAARPVEDATAAPAPPQLSPRELLLIKRDFPDLGQILAITPTEVRFELGGPVPGPGWRDVTAPEAHDAYLGWQCRAPGGWDRIDLEGELQFVSLRFEADNPQELTLQLTPRAAAADRLDGGWRLTLLKSEVLVMEYDIPGPTGGRPRALAIERVALHPGEEQLRFLAVAQTNPDVTADPADPAAAASNPPPREWQVLSERILPTPCPPGHWVIRLEPHDRPPQLQYILQARLNRAALAPDTAP